MRYRVGSLVAIHTIELDPYLTNNDFLSIITVEPCQDPQGYTVDMFLETWVTSFPIVSCVEHNNIIINNWSYI